MIRLPRRILRRTVRPLLLISASLLSLCALVALLDFAAVVVIVAVDVISVFLMYGVSGGSVYHCPGSRLSYTVRRHHSNARRTQMGRFFVSPSNTYKTKVIEKTKAIEVLVCGAAKEENENKSSGFWYLKTKVIRRMWLQALLKIFRLFFVSPHFVCMKPSSSTRRMGPRLAPFLPPALRVRRPTPWRDTSTTSRSCVQFCQCDLVFFVAYFFVIVCCFCFC